MELIVDTREKKLIEILKEHEDYLTKNNINYNIKALDIGDFIIKKKDEIILIIERKTIGDLYGSIQDGRYKEQKLRLTSNYSNPQIMYILEGSIREYTKKFLKNFSAIINGAIVNTVFRDKIKVMRTSNIVETRDLLLNLYKKINTNIDYFVEHSNNNGSITDNTSIDESHLKLSQINNPIPYQNTIKIVKKNNITPRICNISQLSQIPGVSIEMSTFIIDKYGSIYSLIMEYNKNLNKDKNIDNETMLKNMEYTTGSNKKRKIGPVISKKIYEFIGL